MTAFAVVASLHLVWCLTESLAARGRPAIAPPPEGLNSGLALGALAITAMALHSAWHAETSGVPLLLGVLLGTAGIGLRVAAILTLGDRFLDGVALLPSNHALETGGIYSCLRHPAELGFLLILLGTVLLAGSTLAAVTLLAWVLPLSLVRMKRENQLLAPLVAHTVSVTFVPKRQL